MSGLTEAQRETVRQFLLQAIPGPKWRTQAEAGSALNVSQEYLSQLRSGKKPIGPSIALKIAAAVGVGFDDLISGRAVMSQVDDASNVQTQKRSFTPTPIPASSIRIGGAVHQIPETPPNRQRALELLIERGFDRDQVDEAFALLAFDDGLAPFEDRPVAWWIDGVRPKLLANSAR